MDGWGGGPRQTLHISRAMKAMNRFLIWMSFTCHCDYGSCTSLEIHIYTQRRKLFKTKNQYYVDQGRVLYLVGRIHSVVPGYQAWLRSYSGRYPGIIVRVIPG